MSEADMLPSMNPLTKPFWEAARNHKLVMQRCTKCKRFHWLPVPACQSCGNATLTWEVLSGRGRIYTYTTVHQVVRNAAFKVKTPYVVGMVELDEGPRMIAPVENADSVRIGAMVTVVFEDLTAEISLPRFRLER